MKPEAAAWLAKSEEDRLAAEWLLQSEAPLTLASAFHIQQCAEKLLKALLVEKGRTFEKRHDLPYLLERASHETLRTHVGFLEELSPYAVEFRYPSDFHPPTEREAKELLSQLLAFRTDLLNLI
jgi:HEPN domain-containing protein